MSRQRCYANHIGVCNMRYSSARPSQHVDRMAERERARQPRLYYVVRPQYLSKTSFLIIGQEPRCQRETKLFYKIAVGTAVRVRVRAMTPPMFFAITDGLGRRRWKSIKGSRFSTQFPIIKKHFVRIFSLFESGSHHHHWARPALPTL